MGLRIVVWLGLAAAIAGAAGDTAKPRVFIAGSEPETVSGEAQVGETQGTLALTRTAPSYDIESMRAFALHCPGAVITTNRDKADVIVRVQRDDPNPATLFVKANKVAVFNLEGELVHATRARLLGNAIKDACPAVMKRAGRDKNSLPPLARQ
ncbi:MAG: hypothetical protein HY822_19015 [Acidobacteria bacterium]|nr:hypothetical protein [Acidobacteriota bacterium]